jgi:transcriptional regulator with XRE-family HTH domain
MSLRYNLSVALKEAKLSSGLRYEDLIELTGLSRSIINNALNGGREVGLDTFQKLFNACDCDVEIGLICKENGLF